MIQEEKKSENKKTGSPELPEPTRTNTKKIMSPRRDRRVEMIEDRNIAHSLIPRPSHPTPDRRLTGKSFAGFRAVGVPRRFTVSVEAGPPFHTQAQPPERPFLPRRQNGQSTRFYSRVCPLLKKKRHQTLNTSFPGAHTSSRLPSAIAAAPFAPRSLPHSR